MATEYDEEHHLRSIIENITESIDNHRRVANRLSELANNEPDGMTADALRHTEIDERNHLKSLEKFLGEKVTKLAAIEAAKG